MKIAIVENEKREVEGAFSYLNSKYFEGGIEFRYFETSQECLKEDLSLINYAAIIIDIHLTKKSQFDGFGLIKKLLELSPDWEDKILVLTGYHKVEEKLKDYGLPSLPVIVKPVNFTKLLQALHRIGIEKKQHGT
jgi:DNA-binding response OmpR family regulator